MSEDDYNPEIDLKAVIQRRIVPNLDIDLKISKMKVCGVLEN